MTSTHYTSGVHQRGMTTLAVTLILLVIVTVMVLFSTSIGFFEQKTATNEDRARISQQAAEYALNLTGEYLKANRNQILSDVTAEGGWMAPSTTAHWAKCVDVVSMPTSHPCMSEPDPTRRAQLYFWTDDGTTGACSGPKPRATSASTMAPPAVAPCCRIPASVPLQRRSRPGSAVRRVSRRPPMSTRSSAVSTPAIRATSSASSTRLPAIASL